MINGAHFLLYSTDPEADRRFLRDVLEFPGVDAGGGWLILALPPAEIAVHPSELSGRLVHFDAFLRGRRTTMPVSVRSRLFTDVSGSSDLVGSQVGGRGFLKVYAVDKNTGEQYLLIYEDIRQRKRPVQVIRFRSVQDDSLFNLRPPV